MFGSEAVLQGGGGGGCPSLTRRSIAATSRRVARMTCASFSSATASPSPSLPTRRCATSMRPRRSCSTPWRSWRRAPRALTGEAAFAPGSSPLPASSRPAVCAGAASCWSPCGTRRTRGSRPSTSRCSPRSATECSTRRSIEYLPTIDRCSTCFTSRRWKSRRPPASCGRASGRSTISPIGASRP